jgi:hypothetical protein
MVPFLQDLGNAREATYMGVYVEKSGAYCATHIIASKLGTEFLPGAMIE